MEEEITEKDDKKTKQSGKTITECKRQTFSMKSRHNNYRRQKWNRGKIMQKTKTEHGIEARSLQKSKVNPGKFRIKFEYQNQI